MEHVPVRDLNQDTASVLARVERGEVVEITNRGKPIARIIPAEHSELDDLISRGRVVPASSSGPIPRPSGPVDELTDSTRVVSELRDERL
jgi:prevent-host-death family protein